MAALAVALLAVTPPALGWNAAGHRLVAAIAWREMPPETRERAATLLAAHPDHTHWMAAGRGRSGGKGGHAGYPAFLEAATWADDIRRDARFHEDDDPPTQMRTGFPDMARHRHWHYAELPPPGVRPIGELDRRLPQLLHALCAQDSGTVARHYALPWVLHLVADAHQPLHVYSRYDASGRSDRGGNERWVETPLHPRRKGMSLHAYWDDLPGPPWLRGERLESAVDRLLAASRPITETGTPGQWIEESRELAVLAYGGLDTVPAVIGENYHARAVRTAEERIVLAGRRLARILEVHLDGRCVSRETSD